MPFDGFPLVVGFELTLACNLHCKHCASSAGNPRADELSLEEIKRICDQFPYLLVREVDFTGGEPLVRPDWFEIALHLRALNIPVRMVSNGVLLGKNVPRLVEAGIATVGISFDGLEQTHDFIRERPGLFKTILSGVETALAANIPVAAITAVNDQNVGELAELHRTLDSMGVRHWQVQPIFARGRAREEQLNLSTSSFLGMGTFVRRCIESHCDTTRVEMMPADGVGYFTDLDTRESPWQGCGAGISTCGITANGKVKGCLSLPDTCIEGDLRERDLWDIWFDPLAFAYNRGFRVDQLGENCQGCQFGEQCRGGCSVMSFAASGRFHNDPYCFHGIRNGHGRTQPD